MKILVLTSRFPYPLEKGDKLRAYHQICALSERHEIVLVALTEGPVPAESLARLEPWCSSIHLIERSRPAAAASVVRSVFDASPLQVGYFRSSAALRRLRQIVAEEQPDHLYCQLVRTAEYGRSLDVPSTLDYQDAFSVAALRHAGTARPWLRPVLRSEAARVARYERKAFSWFDRHVIISEQDRALLDFDGAERIDVVPNGVDIDYFAPVGVVERPSDLVFVGNMGYAPNISAVEALVHEILPLVRAERPDADVLIAGARPSRAVRRLAGPGVQVLGWVDDIRTAYSSGRVMIAPLRIGAGQQNKVLEAMAMGVPCVTSELVNRAIGAEPGRELLVASSAEEFARAALSLLGSPDRREEIAEAGRQFVRDRYSWRAVGVQLGDIFAAATTGPDGRGTVIRPPDRG